MRILLTALLGIIVFTSHAQQTEWVELAPEADKSIEKSEGFVGLIDGIYYFYEHVGKKLLKYDADYNLLGEVEVPKFGKVMAYPTFMILDGKLMCITYVPYMYKEKKVEMQYLDVLAGGDHKILFEHPFVAGGIKIDMYDLAKSANRDSFAIVLLKERNPLTYTITAFDHKLQEIYSKELVTDIEKTFKNHFGMAGANAMFDNTHSFFFNNGDVVIYGWFTDEAVPKDDPNHVYTLLIHYDYDKDEVNYGHLQPKHGSGEEGGLIYQAVKKEQIYKVGSNTEGGKVYIDGDGNLNEDNPFYLITYGVNEGKVIMEYDFSIDSEMKKEMMIDAVNGGRKNAVNGKGYFDVRYFEDDLAVLLVELDETVVKTANNGLPIYHWLFGDVLVYLFQPSTGKVLSSGVVKKFQNKIWVKDKYQGDFDGLESLGYSVLEGERGLYIIFNTSNTNGSNLESWLIDKEGNITKKVLLENTQDNQLVPSWIENDNILYLKQVERKNSHRYLKVTVE